MALVTARRPVKLSLRHFPAVILARPRNWQIKAAKRKYRDVAYSPEPLSTAQRSGSFVYYAVNKSRASRFIRARASCASSRGALWLVSRARAKSRPSGRIPPARKLVVLFATAPLVFVSLSLVCYKQHCTVWFYRHTDLSLTIRILILRTLLY